ncbi:MAG: undecaprenyl/decaprenyl-phosphate alpha-N-acetylglucosaminyl 1-phosphate transferase [Microscillaceae bacterium]|nr:undecaprenyl/decaprenyl-phosphate alpha-N-acetylglucosaminyl 1-phosphate transferase [Microscillaceae bacterium]MDW8459916.1 MraY family glycosyltransferase [Cytophagales bacterium]
MILLILFLTGVLAFLISWLSIPALVRLAEQKYLFDEPDTFRKIHKRRVPTLGGIAIFGGLSISWCFFADFTQMPALGVVLTAILILFFTGVKDDIIPLSPYKKLIAQLIATFILAWKGDIRLTSFYGFLWIYEIPFWLSIVISVFTLLVITNAFNLLDGINGLAGGIGVITSLVFGFLFYQLGLYQWTILSTALAGAVAGFLRYNLRNSAGIFMGDTGSLTIGVVIAVLAVNFIEMHKVAKSPLFRESFAPVLAVTILIIPLFDTLRLFIQRILNGKSPLKADCNHLHHYLTRGGLSHWASSLLLYCINLIMICIVLLLENTYNIFALTVVLVLAGAYTYLAYWFYKKKEQKQVILLKKAELIKNQTNSAKVI